MKLSDLFEKTTKRTAWVILFTSERLILGKRAPATNNPNLWNFFGGTIDEGESAVDAAVRELDEEINFKASASDLKLISEIGDATYFTLKVENISGSSPTDEISKIKAYKLTELPDNLHSKTANFFNQLDTFFNNK